MQSERTAEKRNITRMTWTTVIAMGVTIGLITLVFQLYLKHFQEEGGGVVYSQYYVMIVEDQKAGLWREIYESARSAGLEQDIYVDLFGDNLPQNYSRQELMEMAIYSQVDGIIVEADESREMTELIDRAVAADIPVVTLYTDNTQSKRCSYVGIGNYDIGREYGRQVLRIGNKKMVSQDVLVLMGTNSGDASQNIIYSGIQETLIQENKCDYIQYNLSMAAIDDSNTFTVEETIRELIMGGQIPDIIICLNELNTSCVYQAVVDYNKVGEVNILGYYTSDAILKGIYRNVIDATITIDTQQMGRYCVNALAEYKELGNTSDYFAADITLIDKFNVPEYMGGKEDAKE